MATTGLTAARTVLAASLAMYAATFAFGTLGVLEPEVGLAIGIYSSIFVGVSAAGCVAIQMGAWLLTSRRLSPKAPNGS